MSGSAEMERQGLLMRLRLRVAMEKKGLSVSKTAIKSGLDRSAVRKILDKKTITPSTKTIIALANTLECSAEWLMGGDAHPDPISTQELRRGHEIFERASNAKGDQKDRLLEEGRDWLYSTGQDPETHDAGKVTIPLVGKVGAGQSASFFDDHELGDGFERIEVPAGIDPGSIAVEIEGESQYPVLKSGSIATYSKRSWEPFRYIDDLCIVRLANGDTLIKTIARGSQPGYYNLLSTNAPVIEDAVIEWVAPIDLMIPNRRR